MERDNAVGISRKQISIVKSTIVWSWLYIVCLHHAYYSVQKISLQNRRANIFHRTRTKNREKLTVFENNIGSFPIFSAANDEEQNFIKLFITELHH